ncbi:MAG: helix-turn-helix domain-containing protein [Dysgonomonas sp.]
MSNIIVTEEDKLRTIVQEEVSKLLPEKQDTKPEIDTITLTAALALLSEHGYPMSKSKLYKLTSTDEIPCRKFGRKLVFSRKEILRWAESQTKAGNNKEEAALILARSARQKMRNSKK